MKLAAIFILLVALIGLVFIFAGLFFTVVGCLIGGTTATAAWATKRIS